MEKNKTWNGLWIIGTIWIEEGEIGFQSKEFQRYIQDKLQSTKIMAWNFYQILKSRKYFQWQYHKKHHARLESRVRLFTRTWRRWSQPRPPKCLTRVTRPTQAGARPVQGSRRPPRPLPPLPGVSAPLWATNGAVSGVQSPAPTSPASRELRICGICSPGSHIVKSHMQFL